MSRVLVTGSEGFIGSSLVKKLLSEGHQIATLDLKKNSNREIHLDCNLAETNPTDFFMAFKPDVVIHLAAQIVVTESISNPENDLMINGLGTLRVVQASISSGCKNFIYIHSGGAIYDSNAELPLEESSPERPVSPYGLSKNLGEGYVRVLSELVGANWSSLALSNCYGPVTKHGKGVIYHFWKALQDNKAPTINGPEVTRDFVYVSDVIDAICLAMQKPTKCRINISSGNEISLIQLYKLIQVEIGSSIEPNIYHHIPGEILRSCLSNKKAHEVLNWQPKIDLEQGIKLSFGSGSND